MIIETEASTETKAFHVFAYGSLIWRPDFVHEHAGRARVDGYERRFWQASHDHRGTSGLPGRVVTLVPVPGGQCEGVVYQLPALGRQATLAALDEREQDGYERVWVRVYDERSSKIVSALTWVASPDNPSWAGEESVATVAQLIASRHGPSGSNREYLMQLHLALNKLAIDDGHIEALVKAVREYAD